MAAAAREIRQDPGTSIRGARLREPSPLLHPLAAESLLLAARPLDESLRSFEMTRFPSVEGRVLAVVAEVGA
jgi:hypothetical protein